MFTLVLSILFYLISYYFKTRPGYYTHHINTYNMFFFAATVLLIVWLYGIVSSLLSRAVFCTKLKRLAKQKGYEYKGVKSPYLSLFLVYGGEDIVLTRREKDIRLKFFYTGIGSWFIHIINDKKACFTKKMAFMGFVRQKAPGTPYVGGSEWVKWGKLMSVNKKIDMSFTKEVSENIIIIPQKCLELSAVEGNSRKIVGSGHVFNGKKLYFQKDFLNYFDRT